MSELKMLKAILSQAHLKKLFDYNPATGILVWRNRPCEDFKTRRAFGVWNARFPGKPAGYICNEGYLVVRINGILFKGHRIILKLLTGEEPSEVDHINGVRDDNKASNLRAATSETNMKNTKLRIDNTSGIVGVFRDKNKWVAQIGVDGKNMHLGYFDDFSDAAEARLAAEIKHGFHINHGRA